MPATHNGTTFTFDLSFSENVKAGYERIRDDALNDHRRENYQCAAEDAGQQPELDHNGQA